MYQISNCAAFILYKQDLTGSSNGGVKTFDVTVRKLYTLHGG